MFTNRHDAGGRFSQGINIRSYMTKGSLEVALLKWFMKIDMFLRIEAHIN